MGASGYGPDPEATESGGPGEHVGDLSEDAAARQPQGPTRGSGEPSGASDPSASLAAADRIDPERTTEGQTAAMPRVDADDPGDPGARPPV